MRSIVVVVVDELLQDGHEMALGFKRLEPKLTTILGIW